MLQDGQEILEGRFQIVKKLGSGAFGEIYKVEKKKTKQFYAAKIVSFAFISCHQTRDTRELMNHCIDANHEMSKDKTLKKC